MMRPTTINKFGVVLDDFGLDGMLQKLLGDFISPISQGCWLFLGICLQKVLFDVCMYVRMCFMGLVLFLMSVLFPEVCGTGLDSHHGYAIEYGKYRDTDLGKYFWEGRRLV